MAEVKKQNKNKSKKSSKVLDKNVTLNNDELLEQIINKKKNKQKSSSPSKKKDVNNSNKAETLKVKKTSVKLKDYVSSDDLYEQIKAKRAAKKKTTSKKENVKTTIVDIKENYDNLSKQVDEDFTKVIKEINEENNDLIITREIRFDDLSSDLKNKKTLEELRSAIEEYDKLDGDQFANASLKDDIDILPSIKYSNYKVKKKLAIV